MTDAELIKSKIDIVSFISDYIQLKKAGRNFKALCPFHSEKTPSFVVSPERGTWHCFGACGEGGDVITFLQKWENLDFFEALKIMAKRVNITLSHYTPSDSSKIKEKLYEINHLAGEFYHFLLTSHQLGVRTMEYLKNRGIKKETIETFSLGYAPNSWDSLLLFLLKKGYEKNDIFNAGLLVKSERGSFYDRFRGRLMFALKDHWDNVIGFSGRKLPSENKKSSSEEKEAKYINTPETPVYIKGQTLYGLNVTKEAIKKQKTAVVVEGEFDFLSSYQSGVTNIVAIKGSALTEGQILLLKRFTENLILALDCDFAGNEAARRGIEIADEGGLNVRIVRLPTGKDPADCIEKSPHLWKKAIKEAISIYDFIIDNALKKYDKNDALGKKDIGKEVIPLLAKIANPIIQSHYVRKLAQELLVSEESIQIATKQFQKRGIYPKAESVLTTHPKREDMLEEYLLALIIQNEDPPKTLASVLEIINLEDFTLVPVKNIIEQLFLYFKKHQQLDAKQFPKVLAPEVIPTFDRSYMIDIQSLIGQSKVLIKELTTIAKEVKKNSLKRKINSLSTKIRELDVQDKEEEVKKYNEKLKLTLEQLTKLINQPKSA